MTTKINTSSMLFDVEGISVAQLIEFLQGIENPNDAVVKVNSPVFDCEGEHMYDENATVTNVTLHWSRPWDDMPAYITLTV